MIYTHIKHSVNPQKRERDDSNFSYLAIYHYSKFIQINVVPSHCSGSVSQQYEINLYGQHI